MKKVFLTGSNGFLGSHLLNSLANEYEIFAIKRSTSDMSRISDYLQSERVRFFDVNQQGVGDIFNEVGKIDFVIHTATAYKHNKEPIDMFDSNVRLPLELLQQSYRSNPDVVFINTDSFFNKDEPVRDTQYQKEYTLTKKQFVEWGKVFSQDYGVSFVNMKLHHVYGAFDQKTKFITFIMDKLKGEDDLLLTAGSQLRDFVFVDDVVEAYKVILNQEHNGFVNYEVGSGVKSTVREFVETAHKLMKSEAPLKFGNIPTRDDEIMDVINDISLLRSLGWNPMYSIRRGIERMIEMENKSHKEKPL